MLASSVPWLMPPAVGDLETLNERTADQNRRTRETGRKVYPEQLISTPAAFDKSLRRGWAR